MQAIRVGIVVFASAVLSASWYSDPAYRWHTNLISELGAQLAPHREVMVLGFVAMGLGTTWGAYKRRLPAAPFFAGFGAAFAAAGLFPHRPLFGAAPHNELNHSMHMILAAISGVCLTLAFARVAMRASTSHSRAVAWALCSACVALPLAMLRYPDVQGAIQRLMYTLICVWLWNAKMQENFR